jgi:uncharacterized protein YjbI with pentapeptide repeats
VLSGLLGLGAVGLAVMIVWIVPSLLTRHPHLGNVDRYKAINDTRTGLVGAAVAIGAFGGLVFTGRTYLLSRSGQFTDRYSKAVEQLGDDELEVRLGGIYALERLMADSPRDQPTILEVLCAWVRQRTSSHDAPEDVLTSLDPVPDLATDCQAVLTVIGRRSRVKNERIDLRRAVLPGVIFPEPAHFEGADLREAHLERGDLVAARLEGADLREAHLERGNLRDAHLERARLTDAHLEVAQLQRVHLEEADLTYAHLELADLELADLKGAYLGHAELEQARLVEANLERARLAHANLVLASLGGAYLEQAELSYAHLEGAVLSRAHLEQATLGGAYLQGADLTDAELEGAYLVGADLSDCRGLTQSQIYAAAVDETTMLPKGLRRPGERLVQTDQAADHEHGEDDDQ